MVKLFKEIVVVVIIIMSVYTLILQNYKIPSGSMKPTLNIGDQILVNKSVYGWTIPKLPMLDLSIVPNDKDQRITFLENIRTMIADTLNIPSLKSRTPILGEIVAFQEPETKIPYVKRAVATEGMSFMLRKDGFWLEDNSLLTYKNKEKKEIEGRTFIKNPLLNQFEVLDNENRKLFIYKISNKNGLKEEEIKGYKIYTVKKGFTFMLGDNRNNSKDSRFIGAIENKYLLGKVFYRFFEINENIGVNNNRSF